MPIQNVALIGGTGTVGAPILTALQQSSFKTFVLNRESSKSTYPNTDVIIIPDDLDVSTVAQLLTDNRIDALIIAIKPGQIDDNKKLVDAAFASTVQRVIPAEFGSVDSADAKTCEVYPLCNSKTEIRNRLISMQHEERSNGRGKLSWSGLVPAHFFDWGLTNTLLCFDVPKRKAYIQDGGDIKFSASNLPFIAKAVVRILERPEETQNQLLYVQSFRVTQNEVLAVLEKVTGDTFEKIPQSSEEQLRELRPKMLAGDYMATETTVGIWGLVAADWAGKKGFANELLGLEEEDLEETVRKAVSN